MSGKKQKSPPPVIRFSQKLSELLLLTKLRTCEDDDAQEGMKKLYAADRYAREIMTGGGAIVGVKGEGPWVRFVQALDVLGEERCDCRACEANMDVESKREEAAYYIGLAVGLRLARAVDGPVTGQPRDGLQENRARFIAPNSRRSTP